MWQAWAPKTIQKKFIKWGRNEGFIGPVLRPAVYIRLPKHTCLSRPHEDWNFNSSLAVLTLLSSLRRFLRHPVVRVTLIGQNGRPRKTTWWCFRTLSDVETSDLKKTGKKIKESVDNSNNLLKKLHQERMACTRAGASGSGNNFLLVQFPVIKST